MGMSAARCQGNVREFQSVWRVVTLAGPTAVFVALVIIWLPPVVISPWNQLLRP